MAHVMRVAKTTKPITRDTRLPCVMALFGRESLCLCCPTQELLQPACLRFSTSPGSTYDTIPQCNTSIQSLGR